MIWVRIESNVSADCYGVGSINLIVNPAPTVTEVPDLIRCDFDGDGFPDFDLTENEAEILGGQTGLTVTYYTSQEAADDGLSPIVDPSDYSADTTPMTIYVRVESGPDCYNTTSFDLLEGDSPITTFSSDVVYEVCPNATVPVTVTATPVNYSPDEVSIVWYLEGEEISGATGLSLPVLVAGSYEIEVTYVSTGCSGIEEVEVVGLESCVIPQGISPDGDGRNDTFDLSSFGVVRLEIFNRLGRQVYAMDNYTDQWHGQSDSGDELPVGTYFYTMVYQGGAKTKSSWVYINR